MLTDAQIRQYVQQGKISITPFSEDAIGSGNYQVRLGSMILVPEEGQTVDLKEANPSIVYTEISMDPDTGYTLKPKGFILGQTLEKIAMDDDIGMLIDGRSTLARLGMSIHQSSTTMLPGQDAHIVTLEIFNAGNFTIKIYPEMKIGKLVMFQSSEPNQKPYRHYGQYSGQQQTTAAKL